MSSTPPGPDTDSSGATAPAEDAPPQDASQGKRPQPRTGMRGNWRSLALSMGAVGLVVLVLYAIAPQPEGFDQPPVDVTPVAQQVYRDTGDSVWIPQLGPQEQPWKSTSVRWARSAEGLMTWYAGYHRTDDDAVFVAVQQTPADAADPNSRESWVSAAVSHGGEDGTVEIDGVTWTRHVTGGDATRRGLVGEVDGWITVVSGLADYDTLQHVVESLEPHESLDQ